MVGGHCDVLAAVKARALAGGALKATMLAVGAGQEEAGMEVNGPVSGGQRLCALRVTMCTSPHGAATAPPSSRPPPLRLARSAAPSTRPSWHPPARG